MMKLQRAQRGSGALSCAIALVSLITLAPIGAWSADTASSPSDSFLPPSLGLGNGQGMGAGYGVCTQNTESELAKLFATVFKTGPSGTPASGPSGTPGLGGLCKVPDEKSFPEVPESCSSYVSSNGTVNEAQFKKFKQQLETFKALAECAEKQVDLLQKDVECLKTQMDQTAKMLTEEAKGFNAYRTAALTELNSGNDYLRELKGQQEEIGRFLNGDDSTGKVGMLAALTNARGISAGMDSEINAPGSGVKPMFKNNEIARKLLDEFIPVREAGLAKECFANKTQSNYICYRGGQPMPFPEYVACMYEETLKSTGGGSARTASAGKLADAKARATRLKGLIARIVAKLPETSVLPSSAEELKAAANKNYEILTADAVSARYSAELKSYDTSGINVSDSIMSTLRTCFSEAKKTVANEKTGTNSFIARETVRIQDQELMAKTIADGLIKKYDNAFRDMVVSMGMKYTRPDIEGECIKNATPAKQTACLDSAHSEFDHLLKGTSQSSLMNVALAISKPELAQRFPQLTVNFQCAGLEACVAALQKSASARKEHESKGKKARANFIAARNGEMMTALTTTAQNYSSAMQGLTAFLGKLQGSLSQLGGGSIDIEVYEKCAEPDYDQSPDLGEPSQELMKAPTDFMEAIGCRTVPASIKFDGKTTTSALEALKPASEKASAAKASATKLLSQLESKMSECVQEVKDKFKEIVDGWTGGCWGTKACPKAGESGTDSATQSWNQILKALGQDVSLDTGAAVTMETGGIAGAYCVAPSEATGPHTACKFNPKMSRFDNLLEPENDRNRSNAIALLNGCTKEKIEDRNHQCAIELEKKQKQCEDANKALLDVIKGNQASCGKTFGEAAGKSKIFNAIDLGGEKQEAEDAE